MRRYETRERTTQHHVLVEETCDGCGRTPADAVSPLILVAIEVNHGEEQGARDEYDYCDDCLIERADRLVAAGSRSPLVTGGDAA